jgi:uncharacterized protein (TIGR00369 family)
MSAPTPAALPGDAVSSAARHAELDPEATRRRELVWQDPVATFERAAGLSGLEHLRAIASGELPPPPIAVLMRMAPVDVTEGAVAFAGEPDEEHYNPIGVVHGGYASTLLDTVLGCAVQTTLEPGEAYTTQSLEVKLLRPITAATVGVRAEAEVVHRGRRQATAEGRLYAVEGRKLLATGTTSCMLFSG